MSRLVPRVAFGTGRLQAGEAALMLRLVIIALFGWAAYRIVEENRPAVMLLPPPDDAGDAEEGLGGAKLSGSQRRRAG